MKTDDIRCGMIGTGGRGRRVLECIRQVPGVRVTALCDINQQALAQGAEIVKEHNPRRFADYRQLLAFSELDAVFVHTPCDVHAEMYIAVLKSDRHIYAEKPIGLTVAECDAIVAAAKASPRIFQVGTQLRYAWPWGPTIRAIQDGRVGRILMVRAHRQNTGQLPLDAPWVHTVKRSGDTIVEQAVHEFDMMNWALGRLPIRASGFGGQSVIFEPPGRDLMDHFGVTFDYGNDLTVSYSHSWLGVDGIPEGFWRMTFYGTDGTADIRFRKGFLYMKPEGKTVEIEDTLKTNWDQPAIDDFFRCIREGDKPLANVEAGRDSVLVALLGRKAIYEQRVVTMGEILAENAA